MKDIESSIQIIISILTDEKLFDFIEILNLISNKIKENKKLNDILKDLNCFNDLSLTNHEKITILKIEINEMIEKNFILNLNLKNLKKYQELHIVDFQNFLKLLLLFKKSLEIDQLDKLMIQISKIEKFFKNQKNEILEIISPEFNQFYQICCVCCFSGESQFMIDTNDLFENLKFFLNLDEITFILDELNQFSFDNTFFHSDIFINSISNLNEDFLLEIDKSFIILNQMKQIFNSTIEISIDLFQIDFKKEIFELIKQENIENQQELLLNDSYKDLIENLKENIEIENLNQKEYISMIEQEKYIETNEKSKSNIELEMIEYHPQIHNDIISINSEIEIEVLQSSNEEEEEKNLLKDDKFIGIGIAISDYFAQQDGELSFNEGDIIFVLNKKPNSGWWFGMINNEEGYFPSNFFEEKKITKAIHDYDAQDENELSFKEGDIIAILEEDEDGWFIGSSIDGKIGQFPVNFTKAGGF